MDPIVGSLLFYVFFIGLAQIAHNLISRSVRNNDLRMVLHEFIGTLQMTTCLHEGGVAIKLYGTFGIWLTVFLMVLVNEKTVVPYAEANPLGHFDRTISSRSTPGRDVLLCVTAEIVAACLSIYAAKTFWMFGISYEHESLFSGLPCSMSYKWLLAMVLAGLSEIAFTATLRILLSEVHKRCDRTMAQFGTAVTLATMVAATMFFRLPAFMNPIMALAMASSCDWTIVDHVIVHWICPTIGWVMAAQIQNLAMNAFGGVGAKKSN